MARTAHHRRGITGVTIGIAAVIVLGGCANSNADAPETSSLGSGIGSGVTTTVVTEASAPSTAAIHALSARSFDISQNLAGRPPLFDVDGVSYVSDDGQFV
jgi:hypothetical protein